VKKRREEKENNNEMGAVVERESKSTKKITPMKMKNMKKKMCR